MMVPGTWIEYSNSTGGYVVVDAKKIFEAAAYFNHKSNVRVTQSCVAGQSSALGRGGIQISYVWRVTPLRKLLAAIWRFIWR